MTLTFKPIHPDDPEICELFKSLMRRYIAEISAHLAFSPSNDLLERWISSIIRLQGEKDRILDLCYADGVAVGFLYGKVDKETDVGCVRDNWGYVMEFYVKPDYRRKGIGSKMFDRMREWYGKRGVLGYYLTADPINGELFWEALGFEKTREIMPTNNMIIFERTEL